MDDASLHKILEDHAAQQAVLEFLLVELWAAKLARYDDPATVSQRLVDNAFAAERKNGDMPEEKRILIVAHLVSFFDRVAPMAIRRRSGRNL
jgi:hypothetical protein